MADRQAEDDRPAARAARAQPRAGQRRRPPGRDERVCVPDEWSVIIIGEDGRAVMIC